MLRPAFWLLVAVAAAAYSRLYGISFGLPLHLHPDEWSQVETARNIASGHMNPGFFRYPSLMMYHLALIFTQARLVGALIGVNLSSSDYYLLGRLLSACYGIVTVVAVYYLGSIVLGRKAGAIAALVLALSPEHIRQSHYATVDVAAAFWCVAALGLALIAAQNERRSFLPSAVALGLAISTKYSSLVVAPAVVALIAWRTYKLQGNPEVRHHGPKWWLLLAAVALAAFTGLALVREKALTDFFRSWTTDGIVEKEYADLLHHALIGTAAAAVAVLVLALSAMHFRPFNRVFAVMTSRTFVVSAGVVVLTFLLTSPFVLLDLPAAARDILYEYRHVSLGSLAQLKPDDPLWQTAASVRPLFPDAGFYWYWWIGQNGWAALTLALAGVTFLARRSSLASIVIGSTIVLLGFILTTAGNKAVRYAMPLLPLVSVLVGVGISVLLERWHQRMGTWLLAGVLLLTLFTPLVQARTILSTEFSLPDTRTLAFLWLKSHVLPGQWVHRELMYTPDLEAALVPFQVTVGSVFDSTRPPVASPSEPDYLVVGRMRLWYLANRTLYPAQAEKYRLLDSLFTPVAAFSGSGDQTGPPVWIYRVK